MKYKIHAAHGNGAWALKGVVSTSALANKVKHDYTSKGYKVRITKGNV
jgi:hypothetical protein